MTDSKAVRGGSPGRSTTDLPDSWDGPSWLERSHARHSRQAPGRHGAITNTLYSYASYKSWAEKVRTSWQAPDGKKPPKD